MEKNFNLDERLIEFSSNIIRITGALPNDAAGNYISGQLIRSGLAPSLQYGEAQGAESKADFVHKMKVALKELRETFQSLRIIYKQEWLPAERMQPLIQENNELIAIFVKSIKTALGK
jgi:four helix bundle protein